MSGVETAYPRILVAVDDSPAGQAALDEAIRLTKNQNARLRIIHVLQSVASDGDEMSEGAMDAALARGARFILDHAAARVCEAGIPAVPALIEEGRGPISGAIIADARQWNAHLIVMGTSGPHRLGNRTLGSVAEGVIHAAPVPVLLVRQPSVAA